MPELDVTALTASCDKSLIGTISHSVTTSLKNYSKAALRAA